MVISRAMDVKMKEVSVIIPCFNAAKYISDTIQSVLRQTYDNYEIIVIDGGSTDETIKILKQFAETHPEIKIIHNENDQGPAHSRLVGINNASAEFIAFLDADDLWHRDKLEIQVSKMKLESLDFTFTDYSKITDDGIDIPGVIYGHSKNSYRQYLRRRGIANSTVIVRKSVIGDIWNDKITKSHGEDTLWWLLLMKARGIDAYRVSECLCKYRIANNGLSRKIAKNQATVWHSYRNDLELSLLQCLYYYPLYMLDVLVRRLRYKFSLDHA